MAIHLVSESGPEPTTAKPQQCWIEAFVEFSRDFYTPPIFRLWAGIVAVGAALERRVFTWTSQGIIYPNLYVLLVAPPGIGKSTIINPVRNLWRATTALHVAPNNMTKAALLDVMAKGKYMKIVEGEPLEYHSLQVAASEFGVFCPAHDLEFLSTLSDIFDCPPNYGEHRRSAKEQIDLSNPQISMLGGVQPDFLSEFLPQVAWGQGFMARVIMIYSDTKIHVDLFADQPDHEAQVRPLVAGLTSFTKRHGLVDWEESGKEVLRNWYNAGCPVVPEHFKLKNYNTRRHYNVIKLSLISAVSRGAMKIEGFDVSRAITWLTDAEALMPEIFKAMVGKSDGDLIREFQIYVAREYARNKGKPIHEMSLITYLQQRTPAYNVIKILELAEKSELIVRFAGTKTFRPGAGQVDPTIVN